MGREIKRVPLDFNWPLKKVWGGYLSPDSLDEKPCPDCTRGYAPHAQWLSDRYWGRGGSDFHPEDNGSTPLTPDTPVVRAFAERNVKSSPGFYGAGEQAIRGEAYRLARLWNGMWMHHLNQDDVDVLIAHDRLHDFTHEFVPGDGWKPRDPMPRPTVEEVNADSITTMRGDNREGVLIRARCERKGISDTCPTCDGHASIEAYPGQRADADAWEPTEPPTGDGYQLWETTSEGSPIGPVFKTAEEIARWLTTDEGGSAVGFGHSCSPMAYEEALGFVREAWAPSMIATGNVLHDGPAFIGSEAALGDRGDA